MGRTISQSAFEALVSENISDLGMSPEEALEDAVQTLTLQGVDLSGIIKCTPGVTSVADNPVIQTLDALKALVSRNTDVGSASAGDLLDKLHRLCSSEAERASIASIVGRNGGVQLLTRICDVVEDRSPPVLSSALRAISCVLCDIQNVEIFRENDGPKIIVDILSRSSSSKVLDSAFSVVIAAVTGNEVLKESFMDLKIDELLVQIMKDQNAHVESLFESIRVLLTPDDNRVLVSQVYGYARRFAEAGAADALVNALREGIGPPSLVSACVALKAVAVNDEICRSISERGGIDAILRCIDDSSEHGIKDLARAACSLLSKLAGSDANKIATVQKGGLDRLIKLSSRFSDDPYVLQEIMSVINVLALRSPENASRAIEAGAGDMAIQAMQKFPTAYQMQRQSCFMIRNLVVRNPENRSILLSNGISSLIRKAKRSHESCKDAAADALRDLGLDDYNT